MNNFMISMKRFFKNKNTVTVLGVIAIILVLFFGYEYQIKKQVNPVSGIPVAAETIQPRTKITRDMIEYIDVAPIVLQSNVIRTSARIIGKYSNINTVIPQGSMFYNETVIDEEDLPDSAFVDLAKNEIPYNFPVTTNSTYGNAITPGSYVDIYMKGNNDSGVLMVGRLFDNIKVLAVKDSAGNNVFENSSVTRTPAYLIFGLVDEYNILLRKASYMGSFSVELFPVPHGTKVEVEGATAVSSENLKSFINAHTVANDETRANDTTGTDSAEGAVDVSGT